jgi:hypothetical protein
MDKDAFPYAIAAAACLWAMLAHMAADSFLDEKRACLAALAQYEGTP